MTAANDLKVPAPRPRPPRSSGVPAKFPEAPHATAASYFGAYAESISQVAASVEPAGLDRAATVLLHAYTSGAVVFACGNGGSAAIANHMQCDHVKGIRASTDLSPRVVSLSASVELLTAIANDLSYEDIFAYQLQSMARPGDVLIAVSSSGRSPNILRALRWAGDNGIRTIALTGFDGGEARKVADIAIHVNGRNYGVIEDLHQAIMHALAQYIRQTRMTASAILSSAF